MQQLTSVVKGAACNNWPPVEVTLQTKRGQHISRVGLASLSSRHQKKHPDVVDIWADQKATVTHYCPLFHTKWYSKIMQVRAS